MCDQKLHTFFNNPKKFGLLGAMVFILIGLLIINAPPSVSHVRAHSWVPNSCGIENCSGDMYFSDPQHCYLADDGFLYDDGDKIAKLIGGKKRPIIKESAPRTGGHIKFLVLKSHQVCSYDSSS